MPTSPLALILVSVSTPEQAADEKQSLETQERDLRAIAEQRGWRVIAALRIPGFSRDYISIEECERDMLAATPPITAIQVLRKMTEDRAYDIFMVRDADRFGRTQSLIMQIAETICVKQGLKIFSQIDNTLVEGTAVRFWAAMTGLRSAGEMDKKKLYRHNGMEKRAERGLHEAITPWFHQTIRDPNNGKALRVELREEYRYIWDAVFKVIVEERIGFIRVEQVLYEKYQIVNPITGRPFRPKFFYETLCTKPVAWGHRSRGLHRHKDVGEWVYDSSVLPPAGATLYYDVLPPIYTGQQADDLCDELRRRAQISGGAKPTHPSTFSGLVVCDYCDNHMAFVDRPEKRWVVYRCQTHDRHKYDGPDCPAKPKSITLERLQDWLRPFLERLLAGEPLEDLFPSIVSGVENELRTIEQHLAAVEAEKTRLIERLGLVPDSLLADYQRQLNQVAERADALQTRFQSLKVAAQSQNRGGQVAAFNDLAQIGLDAFWQADPGRQQQILKRLFGRWKIIVADGKVIGVAQAGRRSNRHPAA